MKESLSLYDPVAVGALDGDRDAEARANRSGTRLKVAPPRKG